MLGERLVETQAITEIHAHELERSKRSGEQLGGERVPS
jgi:hypothetical protein